MITASRYSGQLLRNFQVDYLDAAIASHFKDAKEYRRLRRLETEGSGWHRNSNIINQKIKDGFDDQVLENQLFEQLVYVLPNNYYIFNFNSEKTIEQTLKHLQSKKLPFDKPIYYRNLKTGPLHIVSIRHTSTEIVFLLRAGYTKDENEEKTIFFIPCILDFENKICIIKTREGHRIKSSYKTPDLLNAISQLINRMSEDFSIQSYNKKNVHINLYKMFKEESDRAETIIKKHSTRLSDLELNTKIQEFLKNQLLITDIKSISTYTERIKSTYYQDEANRMEDISFNNRYMFAFSFFDGISTKSSTRDSGRFHVYHKKLYWTLKDIIHDEGKISEVSMYYKFDHRNFDNASIGDDFWYTEVTFKESNNVFLIEFYLGSKDPDRRIKSEYVIRELKKYLPE